jgi:hypothetical protein
LKIHPIYSVRVIKDTSGGDATLIRANGLVPIPAETFNQGSLLTFVTPRDRQLSKSQLVVSALLSPNQGNLTWPP